MTGINVGIKDMHDLSIAVVGSVNLDIVARVDRFPLPGETLTDAILSHFPGGKGANQAVAAQRLGARVSMIACVGDDPAADQALASLRAEGVDLRYCRSLDAVCTGTALILVSAEGENQIVVAPEKALQHACVVGALTTTRLGAQSSPLAAEVARHWRDC